MSRWRRLRSVRVRLTLWYAAAMVVVLAVYASGVFIVVRNGLSRGLDDQLRQDLQWPMEMLELSNGTIGPSDEVGAGDSSSPWLQVWSPTGELLWRSWYARTQPIPNGDQLAARADSRIVPLENPPVRVLSHKGSIGGQ